MIIRYFAMNEMRKVHPRQDICHSRVPGKTSCRIALITHKYYEIDAELKVPGKPVILKF